MMDNNNSNFATAPGWANANAPASHTIGGIEEAPFQDDQEKLKTDDFLLEPYSTLDEPVMETIMRDARGVWTKLKVVLLPLDKNSPLGYVQVASQEQVEQSENQKLVLSKLMEWDLWGPLFICLFLSILLATRAPTKQASAVFAIVFVTMWIGAAVVTINAQLLGGTLSFFQSICVLGYCVFPLFLAASLIEILYRTIFGVIWVDLIWVALGFVWATRASTVFIGQYITKERRALAVYPVFFYYTFIGWLVLLF